MLGPVNVGDISKRIVISIRGSCELFFTIDMFNTVKYKSPHSTTTRCYSAMCGTIKERLNTFGE